MEKQKSNQNNKKQKNLRMTVASVPESITLNVNEVNKFFVWKIHNGELLTPNILLLNFLGSGMLNCS